MNKKRIGLFGGTFDPVHQAHLTLAQYALGEAQLEEVWFLPAAQNPHKDNAPRESNEVRFELLKLAVAEIEGLEVNPIEFKLPSPSYTIHTLDYLKAEHPEADFCWLMGSDQLPALYRWAEIEKLCQMIEFIIFHREEDPEPPSGLKARIRFLHNPLYAVSSTQVRHGIQQGELDPALLPAIVLQEIEDKGYYGFGNQ